MVISLARFMMRVERVSQWCVGLFGVISQLTPVRNLRLCGVRKQSGVDIQQAQRCGKHSTRICPLLCCLHSGGV